MKKIFGMSLVLMVIIGLAGCSNGVSTKDLQKNDWEIEVKENTEDMKMMGSFTDKEMTIYFNTNEMKSNAGNDWEKIGEEFGKKMLDSMKFNFTYNIKGDKLTLKSSDGDFMDLDREYTAKKDGEKIILTPVDNEDGTLTLLPAKKNAKSASSNKAAQSTGNTQTEYIDSESTTTSPSISSTSTEESVSTKQEGLPLSYEDAEAKIDITGIEFLGNLVDFEKEDASARLVFYYTYTNKSGQSVETNMRVTDYIKVTEDDSVSEDELHPSFGLFNYPKFEKLDELSRKNIKSGITINGAMDYLIPTLDKNIIFYVTDGSLDDNVVSSLTITPDQIKSSIAANSSVKID